MRRSLCATRRLNPPTIVGRSSLGVEVDRKEASHFGGMGRTAEVAQSFLLFPLWAGAGEGESAAGTQARDYSPGIDAIERPLYGGLYLYAAMGLADVPWL
ncbi:hypothetical protein J6590_003403 [Homalodisca vitripennis]|nr:hypothetical protein J6590_003403 [Homalodisca vitripennis]